MQAKRYAIFSDVHSNLEALQAVLADIRTQGVGHLVCLGDTVGYNANPAECVELVRSLNCTVILGNHDELAASDNVEALQDFNPLAQAGIFYSREHLSKAQKAWLGELPVRAEFEVFGGLHASLANPLAWDYVDTLLDARDHFRVQKVPYYFFGHTHQPAVFTHDPKRQCLERLEVGQRFKFEKEVRYLVNVGAVGQPRDRDPRACYGILDLGAGTFEYRRVAYDVNTAREKIIKAGLPGLLATRLALGK